MAFGWSIGEWPCMAMQKWGPDCKVAVFFGWWVDSTLFRKSTNWDSFAVKKKKKKKNLAKPQVATSIFALDSLGISTIKLKTPSSKCSGRSCQRETFFFRRIMEEDSVVKSFRLPLLFDVELKVVESIVNE